MIGFLNQDMNFCLILDFEYYDYEKMGVDGYVGDIYKK